MTDENPSKLNLNHNLKLKLKKS